MGCGHSDVQAVRSAGLTGLGESPDVIWTLDGDKRVEDWHRSRNAVPQQQVDEHDPAE